MRATRTNTELKVLIADDHPLVLQAVSDAIAGRDGFTVCEARSGPEALAIYDRERPDVVLCDFSFREGNMSGIECTRRLMAAYPEARVVMFTSHDGDESVAAAMDAGALGYITKATPTGHLLDFLTQAGHGIPVFDPEIAPAVGRLLRNRDARPRAAMLTSRETDVLNLLCSEVIGNREISAALCISEHTTKTHLDSLYGKLGVSSKTAAVARALKLGIVDPASLPDPGELPVLVNF